MPMKVERRQAWLAALRLIYPPKRVYVCSYHVIAKRPSKLYPEPELYLGYNLPPPKKRQIPAAEMDVVS